MSMQSVYAYEVNKHLLGQKHWCKLLLGVRELASCASTAMTDLIQSCDDEQS